MRTKSQQAAIAAVSLFIVSVGMLDAQVGGSISGTVTDNSSAIVTAAKITIANTDTKVERSVGVNGQGFFSVPNLRPGNYSVSAAAPGNSPAVKR